MSSLVSFSSSLFPLSPIYTSSSCIGMIESCQFLWFFLSHDSFSLTTTSLLISIFCLAGLYNLQAPMAWYATRSWLHFYLTIFFFSHQVHAWSIVSQFYSWFSARPVLFWYLIFKSLSRAYVQQIGGCSYCLTPEIVWQILLFHHALSHIQHNPIFSLSQTIMLRSIWDCNFV